MRPLFALMLILLAGCGSQGLTALVDDRADTGTFSGTSSTDPEVPSEGLADADDAASNCPEGETADCSGGCLPERWLGDGLCQERFDCGATDFDDGDCADSGGGAGAGSGSSADAAVSSSCAAEQIEGCDGACVDADWVGDLWCDASLDCAATGADGGDCAVCSVDQVIACDGTCVDSAWLADGWCDAALDCDTWADDVGDCTVCWPGEVIACDGSCVDAAWLGDGWCDPSLDCATWAEDDGDCAY